MKSENYKHLKNTKIKLVEKLKNYLNKISEKHV